MADGITLNAGSGGVTLAADDATDAGGSYYQRIKITDGTANSETHINAGNGTATNALRVTVASDSTGVLSVDDNGSSLTVDNGGTFAVQVDGAALTALQLLDDVVATDGSAALTKGNQVCGTDGTNAQIISTNTSGHINIADGGNTITVDGTVTANLSATDNAVLDTIDAVLDTINAKLVTGTVIGDVNLGATDNAVLDSIATNTTGLNGCVGGTELQVDVVGALPAGTNAIGKLAANSGVDIGDVDVTSISAGSNLIGDVGLSGARTSGGTTIFRSIDLDETEEEIKGTAGQVYWIHCMNLSASKVYLKFYNATAASVVVGTTTPVMTFPIATQGDTNGAGFTLSVPNGIAFGTAITVAATTGVADADTGAPGANEVIVNIGYA